MPRISEANLEEHRRHTMNALLDSAETIMREQGDEALTPANVSRGAGIARNSIYRYVHDMKDLRRQLMARHMPQWVEALEQGLGGITDPAETVVAWVRINLEQSILQGHDWMAKIPLSDAESYGEDDDLWRGGEGTGAGASDTGDRNGKNGGSTRDGSAHPGIDSARSGNAQRIGRQGTGRGKATSTSATSPASTAVRTKAPTQAKTVTDPFCGHEVPVDAAPSLNPDQPSLHQRVNAPIVAAWKRLCPERPKAGIALTEGLVTSGMRLLGAEGKDKREQNATIDDIARATTAIVEELRADRK
ncbi:TetR/AcrR family transcriptional regulator [Bifidobacterium sp. ESL0763]|uniref:TetR/AcrR family transcriptional regulator n=1 Tax=Bifidobacterium sp. ESL0763 TaxID=2983227 RepID=UPI0023F95E0F|nr:TetR/AcrR family transcriptional regulator [Bifidobacterium sp. ESL0763]MDF7663214.1 TetR/AcrR family transcriptional regulator [Bifidobacterium sp. ESL0763]